MLDSAISFKVLAACGIKLHLIVQCGICIRGHQGSSTSTLRKRQRETRVLYTWNGSVWSHCSYDTQCDSHRNSQWQSCPKSHCRQLLALHPLFVRFWIVQSLAWCFLSHLYRQWSSELTTLWSLSPPPSWNARLPWGPEKYARKASHMSRVKQPRS